MTKKKPWPADAIMVVASNRGSQIESQMKASVFVHCRHCGMALAADSETIRKAAEMKERHERPIDFFCIECHTLFDRDQCNVVEDHRPNGGRFVRA